MYECRFDGARYVLSVDNRTEITEALKAFCREHGVAAGEVSGIGAVNEAVMRFFDPATKRYADRHFDEQMEIANLTGNISQMNGEPYLHLHAVFGRRDYTALAGHLLTARIKGACELFVTPVPVALGRRADEDTGLNLYDFGEK